MDPDYEALLNRYALVLLDSKGLSGETYRAYLGDIRHFIAFITERQACLPDRLMVRSYMLNLRTHYSRTSVNRKLSAIKGFFDFVMRAVELPINPFGHVRSLKHREHLPQFLSHDEVFDLIDAVMDPRDRAILELLYSTGIRVGEVETMKCCDVDMHKGFIMVTGKGSKQRYVPVGDRALGAISSYLKTRGINDPIYCTEPLFLNSRGFPMQVKEHQAGHLPVGLTGFPCQACEPACHQAHLCQPHARCRRRPQVHPGDARPCKPFHHPALHPLECRQTHGCI